MYLNCKKGKTSKNLFIFNQVLSYLTYERSILYLWHQNGSINKRIWVRRTINKLYMYNYEECMVVETAKEYVRYIQLVIFWDYSFEIGEINQEQSSFIVRNKCIQFFQWVSLDFRFINIFFRRASDLKLIWNLFLLA